ncbi:MAG TPA: ATP-binding protein [Rhodocyclaceae bacterium]
MGRTLLSRLFLLLALAMTLSALTWGAIFTFSDREPRARNFAQLLSSVANLTRSAVVAADPARRGALLGELSRSEGIRIYVAEDNEPLPPPPDDDFLRRVEQHLQAAQGAETHLALEHNGERAIFLRVLIEGDAYWIALPSERLNRSHSLQWLGWGALAAAIAFAAAAVFVRRLTRPLRDLATAARSLGTGQQPAPLTVSGPEELATVASAFNQMTADLAQVEQDRALILAGVSHDLRTPLARLRMAMELSVSDSEMLAAMESDVDEMDRTIGQFLDFARGNSGEPPEPQDLRALLADLAEQVQRRGDPLTAALDDVGPLPLRPKALRRAISNLIENALRYAGREQPIALSLQRQGNEIRIEVADRGPGIPAAEVERLKRPFTRLEAARSDANGAGLGLAIVERIARQHGGQLDLLANPGGGLLARVRIPAS